MNIATPLLDWYATLTPQTLGLAARYYAPDARFRDPFNDVQGLPAIMAIFEHMFASTEQPRFVITGCIVQDRQAFATWMFSFGLRGQTYQIEGGSHLCFDAQGRVTMHRDYWDAAEELLQKLPVVGGPIRWLRGKFRVHTG
ncbi:nuclear transport factor 2 family protein [Duganella qianjiadongensis]|uniref:Nuclear transport factor 2 family protein n=1 Tax=Duganella qianjiadongensis TaxID=2692176 RepID=A0ABW9VLK0_9BURK|nr:nuclear transport factor 2 family protein [Duganella qianjiadongensis]MYM39780.1 nuclear transport factor 2 family protein [Duganella qianjiadongensis]